MYSYKKEHDDALAEYKDYLSADQDTGPHEGGSEIIAV